jgi:hypothetical protein
MKQTSLKTAPASRQSFFVRGLWLSRLHFSFEFSAVFRILHTIFTLSNHALPIICASTAKFSSDEILRCMKYRGRRVLHEADDVHCPSCWEGRSSFANFAWVIAEPRMEVEWRSCVRN